ncbi:hypothetical protein [Minwuia thermotolerans]|uniref:hypothetical protein n=1 Tax=Minwuia thermotolerans TaxID=2056226 RepID=UPI000D6DC570|nr:hypothetical protein [Minwuia thermotolerans]
MSSADPATILRATVLADGVTCAVMGVALAAGAGFVASLTGLPGGLLFWAGLALLPVAAFMLLTARSARPSRAAAWIIIAGNEAWVLGSVLLMLAGWVEPNALGYAFIAVQAAAVALLATIEFLALRRLSAAAA